MALVPARNVALRPGGPGPCPEGARRFRGTGRRLGEGSGFAAAGRAGGRGAASAGGTGRSPDLGGRAPGAGDSRRRTLGDRRARQPPARAAGRAAARRSASGSPKPCSPGCATGASGRPVAAELGIHPQTVGYRAAQLRELFGDALEDPNGALRTRTGPARRPAVGGHGGRTGAADGAGSTRRAPAGCGAATPGRA